MLLRDVDHPDKPWLVSCRHRWSDPDYRYFSRVEWGEPDDEGWQKMYFVDTREGQGCMRCGVMRDSVCALDEKA